MRAEQKALIEAAVNLEQIDVYKMGSILMTMEVLETLSVDAKTAQELAALSDSFQMIYDAGLGYELGTLLKSYEVHDNH